MYTRTQRKPITWKLKKYLRLEFAGIINDFILKGTQDTDYIHIHMIIQ